MADTQSNEQMTEYVIWIVYLHHYSTFTAKADEKERTI